MKTEKPRKRKNLKKRNEWHTSITIYPRGCKKPSHTMGYIGDHGWNGAMANALVDANRVCREGVHIGKVVVEVWKGKLKVGVIK